MAVATTMDFFGNQEAARKRSAVLVAYYVLAVVLIILAVYAVFAFALSYTGGKIQTGSPFDLSRLWYPKLFLWIVTGTSCVVLLGTVYKINQLSAGGGVVARMLDGRPVSPDTNDPDERRLLNVVEEMAIAAGTPVPSVFVMDSEDSINAFAAGLRQTDAVIAVTRGCMKLLTRDELQGVVAHEFSHILNGDMRLNVRLMGVLNGILLIGLTGYWIVRSVGRSRSRQKGPVAVILLIGLLLMIVGYVGVFFAKLIKSAVSRQREFLGDASAVQFTRNPGGIAGALRKVGGFVIGSRIRNPHAEEASHFFFSNGLGESFFNLMATHPPLKERIRRIDPAFDGNFPHVSSVPLREAEATPLHSLSKGAAGRRGRGTGFAIEPAEVVARVGAPRPEHLLWAAAMLSSMPSAVVEAVRSPSRAKAVIYCLLLNDDHEARGLQIKYLAQRADAASYMETLRLMPAIDKLGDERRLPLADMAISALKSLPPSQYGDFREIVRSLAHADKQIDLFEYTLQRMIVRQLDPVFSGTKPGLVWHDNMKILLPDCEKLLCCLAYWGADDMAQAQRAFAMGVEKLMAGTELKMASAETCGLQALDEALNSLVETSPGIRKRVLGACAACIGADGRVTVEEAELLRAVADSLDCPVPPFLPDLPQNPQ